MEILGQKLNYYNLGLIRTYNGAEVKNRQNHARVIYKDCYSAKVKLHPIFKNRK